VSPTPEDVARIVTRIVASLTFTCMFDNPAATTATCRVS
jgi:hypothetical protein